MSPKLDHFLQTANLKLAVSLRQNRLLHGLEEAFPHWHSHRAEQRKHVADERCLFLPAELEEIHSPQGRSHCLDLAVHDSARSGL